MRGMFPCLGKTDDSSSETSVDPAHSGPDSARSPRRASPAQLTPEQLNAMPLDDVISYAKTHADFFHLSVSLWTKMVVAIEVNNRQQLQTLLEKDKKDKKLCGSPGLIRGATSTLLHLAAYIGNEKMVELLLDSPAVAFVNAQDDTDETPLFIAATRGYPEVLGRLLHAGANPHKANAFNETPLYAAAYQGHTENVRMLLKFGCDPTKRSSEGMTPEAAALSRSHDLVAEILRRTIFWPQIRLVWLGHLKSERGACVFASMKPQTIKKVISYVIEM